MGSGSNWPLPLIFTNNLETWERGQNCPFHAPTTCAGMAENRAFPIVARNLQYTLILRVRDISTESRPVMAGEALGTGPTAVRMG